MSNNDNQQKTNAQYPMMKCGHTANSECNGQYYCVICDCKEIQDNKPEIQGRKAKCFYCRKTTDSKWTLPFFKHTEREFDEYYCGCEGWD